MRQAFRNYAPGVDTSWMRHAACRGAETDVFFPDPISKSPPGEVETHPVDGDGDKSLFPAQAICAGCEVRHASAQYAAGDQGA